MTNEKVAEGLRNAEEEKQREVVEMMEVKIWKNLR